MSICMLTLCFTITLLRYTENKSVKMSAAIKTTDIIFEQAYRLESLLLLIAFAVQQAFALWTVFSKINLMIYFFKFSRTSNAWVEMYMANIIL